MLERALPLALVAACGFAATTSRLDAPAGDGDDATPGGDASVDARPFDFADCPTGYLAVNGAPSRYRIGTTGPYRPAHFDCKDDSAGFTHLAVLDTLAEANALFGAVAAEFWTGIVQEQSQATAKIGWHVITGGAVEPTLWASGQPDESGNPENNQQNVAKLASDGLDDDTYTDNKVVVCECDGVPIDLIVEGYIQP
jgi:hypothetical protein